MKEIIYLIDGYGLIYRSYFAFMKAPRMNPEGENASAVFGFFRTLFAIMKARNPKHLMVVMDSTVPTFRHENYPEYKAGRDKTPEDLHVQVPRITNILEAMNIPVIRRDRFEADDIIAAAARWCDARGYGCGIFSKDKDLFQLVNDNISILYVEKGTSGFVNWGRDEIFANKGVYPEQIVDFLSFTGDSSDNIPGVLGIGEKTAIKLISEYGSLDGVYENLSSIKSKNWQKKLAEGKESAYFSKDLIRLDHDVPVEFTPELFTIGEADGAKVLELFHKEGIKVFDKEFGGVVAAESGDKTEDLPEAKRGTYKLMTDLKEFEGWIQTAKKKGVFSFDIETDNINDMEAAPIGFSFTCEEETGYYLPIRAIGVDCPPEEDVKKVIRGLLEDQEMKLVGQNFKYDYKVLSRWGIETKNIYFDTMIAAWVLDSTATSYNMDKMAERHLNYKTILYSDLIPKKEKLTLAELNINRVTDYAAEDADVTFRLYNLFKKELDKKENKRLKELFFDVEMPLLTVLGNMEMAGITITAPFLEEYSAELGKELGIIEQEIYRECGKEFNIRSTKELQVILFEDRKLEPVKKTKTGFSTDAQVLEILAEEDVVAERVLKHRILSKLKSTYVDTLPNLINRTTGRIHTSYLQTGTATGRLSSNNPNLQNIPIKTEAGRKIRAAFVPRKGHFFLSADYSQIELVVLAHLAEEENLIGSFKAGTDIHRHTSSILFGVEEDAVTASQRRIGKTINFGVIYGMSAFRLARDLKISRKDAKQFIDTYFAEYSGVQGFKTGTIAKAEETGYVETILGRRRRLLNINNKNKTVKMADERIAVNTPIQGSAADIVKLAMLKIDSELKTKKLTSRLILQVHDEVILEVPEKELDIAQKLVKECMESVMKLTAPLMVNVEVQKSWGLMH